MGIVKGILIAIYLVIALVLIVLTLIQTKEDPGLSSTITGSSTNNFYEKNKSRTKEGKQKKWTVILSVVFVVLTIALGIVYMASNVIKGAVFIRKLPFFVPKLKLFEKERN